MTIYWQFLDIFFLHNMQSKTCFVSGRTIIIPRLAQYPCSYPCPIFLSLSLADLLILILAKETLSQLLQNCSSANHWTSACWAIPALDKSADHFSIFVSYFSKLLVTHLKITWFFNCNLIFRNMRCEMIFLLLKTISNLNKNFLGNRYLM